MCASPTHGRRLPAPRRRSETYADPAKLASLGVDVDISKYVACGIVVVEPRNGTIIGNYRKRGGGAAQRLDGRYTRRPLTDRSPNACLRRVCAALVPSSWHAALDLTTARSDWPAFIVASPTVVDVDGDLKLDIVVGTTVGYVYALSTDGI